MKGALHLPAAVEVGASICSPNAHLLFPWHWKSVALSGPGVLGGLSLGDLGSDVELTGWVA